jgi:hypothetical protein
MNIRNLCNKDLGEPLRFARSPSACLSGTCLRASLASLASGYALHHLRAFRASPHALRWFRCYPSRDARAKRGLVSIKYLIQEARSADTRTGEARAQREG